MCIGACACVGACVGACACACANWFANWFALRSCVCVCVCAWHVFQVPPLFLTCTVHWDHSWASCLFSPYSGEVLMSLKQTDRQTDSNEKNQAPRLALAVTLSPQSWLQGGASACLSVRAQLSTTVHVSLGMFFPLLNGFLFSSCDSRRTLINPYLAFIFVIVRFCTALH